MEACVKRILWMLLSALAVSTFLVACGSGGGGGGDPSSNNDTTTDAPAVTRAGLPNGDPVTTAVIGPAGGTVSSFDNRLTVTVPQNAVTADTTFSIEPIYNTAPGGIGFAYRLAPDGVTFASPVTLTYTYSDEDIQGVDPEYLAGAYQDVDGTWVLPSDPVVDTANHTVSVTAEHFTDQSMIPYARITPYSSTLRINGVEALHLEYCFPPIKNTSTGPAKGVKGQKMTVCKTWQNQSVTWTATAGNIHGVGTTASFIAPAKKPDPSVINITAQSSQGFNAAATVRILSEILTYQIRMTSVATLTDGTIRTDIPLTTVTRTAYVPGNYSTYRGTGTAKLTDSAESNCEPFTVEVPITAELLVFENEYSSDHKGQYTIGVFATYGGWAGTVMCHGSQKQVAINWPPGGNAIGKIRQSYDGDEAHFTGQDEYPWFPMVPGSPKVWSWWAAYATNIQ